MKPVPSAATSGIVTEPSVGNASLTAVSICFTELIPSVLTPFFAIISEIHGNISYRYGETVFSMSSLLPNSNTP